MKLSKLLNIFKKSDKKADYFSDFFLHTPSDAKKKIFTEVARRANEDQREIVKKSELKLKFPN